MSIGTVWLPGAWDPNAWADNTWADVGAPPAPAIAPPTPTLLLFAQVATTLGFLGDDGSVMSTPLIFTAGESGPLTLTCTGADGTREDLSSAFGATLRVVNVNGTVAVNGVGLSNLSSNGTGVWNRLSAQVGTAGDYRAQVTVFRSDGTIGYYPSAQAGAPVTILATV